MSEPNETPPEGSATSRAVDDVVERARDALRKTREMLDSSRDLLDRVRGRNAPDDPPGDPPPADPGAPGDE